MNRLTTNKPVSEMGIVDLAYNCCFAKDGEAWYRDFEKELSLRDYIRWLYKTHLEIELPEDIEGFDNYIITDLECGEEYGMDFVIAFLYHMMWSKADLYERLKRYEDLEEQGLLHKAPLKDGTPIWYVLNIFDEVLYVTNTTYIFGVTEYEIGEFGKKFWLSEEEAEKALAEMEKKEK